MIAQRLDGRQEADRLLRRLRRRVQQLRRPPRLATILVGERYDSSLYVRLKLAAAAKVGIRTEQYRLPATTNQRRLTSLIKRLNQNRAVDGILLQLPLPAHLNADQAVQVIDPRKDVDGFHPDNTYIVPPPVAAVIHFVRLALVRTRANVVILGKRSVFTDQLRQVFTAQHHRVTVVQRGWSAITKRADVIITVLGRGPRLLARHVRRAAVVVDVGIRNIGGHTVGDVTPGVWAKAKAITPVPGGVGPMTVAYVLDNTYQLATQRGKRKAVLLTQHGGEARGARSRSRR